MRRSIVLSLGCELSLLGICSLAATNGWCGMRGQDEVWIIVAPPVPVSTVVELVVEYYANRCQYPRTTQNLY